MMRAIVGWSLRYRLLVLGIAAAMMILGFIQLPRMPVDTLPEFAPPYVEVQTEALGLSAEEVEQLITVPLEADLLHGVAWLDEITSESVPGLSSIVLYFEPGTDVIRARQMVAERLTQAHALPNVSKPPVMLQPLSSTSRVLMVGLSSQERSLIEMSVLARWTIRPRLLGVPGVANVAIWGQRDRQLQVLVDPRRLSQERITLQQVIETAGNALWASSLTFIEAATPGTGGFIDTPGQRLGIQHTLPITTPEDMELVPIEEGRGVLIGDVARVVEDHQQLIGDAVVEDGPGLVLVIEKFPDANTLEVTRGVEDALRALQPGLSGITVDPSLFRPADFVESATSNLLLAFIVGLLVVALLLGLLLDWRAAVVTLVTVPVSLAAAGLVLLLLGATVNAMVIAGLILSIAVVVDDVVVSTDGIVRRFRERREADAERPVPAVLLDAVVDGRGAMVAATVVVGVALLPVAVVAGAAAAFLPQVALAYALSIAASLVVSLTVGAALSLLLVARRPGERRPTRLGTRLVGAYERALAATVRRARGAVAAAALVTVAVVLIAATVVPGLGGSLLPSFRERELLIRMDGAPGTSRTEMDRITARAGAELRAVPGVRNVGAHVGRAVTSDQVVNTNAAELWVTIDRAADYEATLAAVREVVDGYPGLERDISTYTSERMADILGETDRDFVVRLYGQDQAVLDEKAAEVREAVAAVPGVVDPAILATPTQPTLDIEVDLAAAERHGLKPGDIRRAATSLLSGIEVGFLFEDQKVFEVVVWGEPDVRHSLSSVGDLLIDTPGGTQVRLGEVADVRIAATPTVIRREGVMRVLDVGGLVEGRDVGAVMADIEARLDAISFPLEYHAEIRGVAGERQADQLRLLAAAIAAAIGVFLLLQATFLSWRLAAMTFVTLPAALLGGVLAGWIATGGSFSLGTLVGLFGVLAIAVRNGTALIVRLQQLERGNGGVSRLEVTLRGARERFVPIVLTAVAAGLALAPFVLLGDLPGFEIVRPMAAVILAGLVTSTLASLFVVPAVYLRSGPSAEAESVAQPVEQPALSPA